MILDTTFFIKYKVGGGAVSLHGECIFGKNYGNVIDLTSSIVMDGTPFADSGSSALLRDGILYVMPNRESISEEICNIIVSQGGEDVYSFIFPISPGFKNVRKKIDDMTKKEAIDCIAIGDIVEGSNGSVEILSEKKEVVAVVGVDGNSRNVNIAKTKIMFASPNQGGYIPIISDSYGNTFDYRKVTFKDSNGIRRRVGIKRYEQQAAPVQG